MKPIYFSAIAKFNLPYDELSLEQQEYLEEGLNKRGDDNGERRN
jgi:hypothetical protein